MTNKEEVLDLTIFNNAQLYDKIVNEGICHTELSADPVLFMGPERKEFSDERKARLEKAAAFCKACPMLDECLEYARRQGPTRTQGIVYGGHYFGDRRVKDLVTGEEISRPQFFKKGKEEWLINRKPKG